VYTLCFFSILATDSISILRSSRRYFAWHCVVYPHLRNEAREPRCAGRNLLCTSLSSRPIPLYHHSTSNLNGRINPSPTTTLYNTHARWTSTSLDAASSPHPSTPPRPRPSTNTPTAPRPSTKSTACPRPYARAPSYLTSPLSSTLAETGRRRRDVGSWRRSCGAGRVWRRAL
jgi:hypothetical protein